MKTKSPRVGPCMSAVQSLVERNPGQNLITYAAHVAPHGALGYGYASVHRAAKAGLIRLETDPSHSGRYVAFPVQ